MSGPMIDATGHEQDDDEAEEDHRQHAGVLDLQLGHASCGRRRHDALQHAPAVERRDGDEVEDEEQDVERTAAATGRVQASSRRGETSGLTQMMARMTSATRAATTRLLAGPAKATSAWPRRPLRRFTGLTGCGLGPAEEEPTAEGAEDGRRSQDQPTHLVEVDAWVERDPAHPAGRVVAQLHGRPGVHELVHGEAHQQHGGDDDEGGEQRLTVSESIRRYVG